MKPQLFCYTCAGGTGAFFDTIEKDLPEMQLVKPDYPGHGSRRKEPFCRNFTELADDLFARFRKEYAGRPYALFGYSMGSIIAAEMLRRILADEDLPNPACVFLAAHEPHGKAELAGFDPGKKDEWVKERTLRFGGIPEKLLNNPAFWRMYLPVFRADYEMIWKYDFGKLDLRTEIPAEIFYSQEDTPLAEMEKWRRYFTGECDFHRYPGNHFFILEHHREMAGVLRRRLL
jgi:surfactin synthase thioesterase subunit